MISDHILDFNKLDDFVLMTSEGIFDKYNQPEANLNKFKINEYKISKTFYSDLSESIELALEFNKGSFNEGLNSLYLGEDLDSKKIKESLLNIGVNNDDIIIIDKIEDIPFSTMNYESSSILNAKFKILERLNKGDEKKLLNISRLIILEKAIEESPEEYNEELKEMFIFLYNEVKYNRPEGRCLKQKR